MERKAAHDAIRHGLNYITHAQNTDGSFAIIRKPSGRDAPDGVRIGIHAYLLDMVGRLPGRQAARISRLLATYLISLLPSRPDQLDGTDSHALFHALAALYDYDRTLVDDTMIADAVRFLIRNEFGIGGPYRNALDAPGAPPEPATNITISRFVHCLGGPYPKLNAYIARDYHPELHSRYYTAAWPLALQLERTRTAITDRHLTAQPFSQPSEVPVTSLLGAQQTDGSWRTELFYVDPWAPHSSRYGCRALTTAVVMDQLSRSQLRPATARRRAATAGSALALAHRQADTFTPAVSERLHLLLDNMATAGNSQAVGWLAAHTAAATLGGRRVPASTLHRLDAANLYNWVAYSLYDDVLDGESDASVLPTANIALRTAQQLFLQAVPTPAYATRVLHTFTVVDSANAWELAHCRFISSTHTLRIGPLPPFGTTLHNLYERSLSHSLPLFGALAAAGVPENPQTTGRLQQAFEHYLLIRQLSDDLLDWKDDLRAGRITYPIALALAETGVTSGSRRLTPLISRLERIFWQRTLGELCQQITARAAHGRQLIAASGLLQDTNVLDKLLGEGAAGALRLADEHQRSQTFLQAYRAPR